MGIEIVKYKESYEEDARRIWNDVVKDGNAFPQIDGLSKNNADNFFKSQSYTGIAKDSKNGEVLGLYILHPNNIGRCGHIANASFAVDKSKRGLHVGEMLVKDCLEKAKELGFKILQFNAVVASNIHAQHLYERIGFTKLGRIPEGFKNKDGIYEDIFIYYINL